MIWATISSQSCFNWLYRASPPLAAKNIISLISVLTIWWCPCVESSPVLLEEGVCYDQCILDRTWLAFALLHSVLQGQICLLLHVSWLPTFAFQSPIMIGHLFWVLDLKGLIGIHRTVQLQLLLHYRLGHRLGLLWYWMVFLGNEQRSFCHFEIATKYCILDSFVDYDGYSISSKGFLPTVVDIMVIWVKFTHSSPFLVHWFLKCQHSI